MSQRRKRKRGPTPPRSERRAAQEVPAWAYDPRRDGPIKEHYGHGSNRPAQ